MRDKHIKALMSVDDGVPGAFRAAFSVFNEVDDDGDVVLPSFFQNGQRLLLAAWGHNWGDLNVGKGAIEVQADRASFVGQFYTDTIPGEQHYRTVKNNGDLQEWSFGFRVLEQEPGDFAGRVVNFLKRGEIYEVSPVLIGANRNTRTESIKSGGRARRARAAAAKSRADTFATANPIADRFKLLGYMDEYCDLEEMAPEGSYEALSEDIEDAFEAMQIPAGTYGYVEAVATFPSHAILYMWRSQDPEATFWDVTYSVAADGSITLGTPVQVEPEVAFVPAKGHALGYGVHAVRVGLAVDEIVKRTAAGSALRLKEGRAISTARREQLTSLSGSLRTGADQLDAMLEETAPAPKGIAVDEARAVIARLRRLQYDELASTTIGGS